ncbi:MAG: hypothetical protein K2Q06_14110 [Parvularculaceae bacterium]|nr:hypothetical protein [Parvularculaceae bacterium]
MARDKRSMKSGAAGSSGFGGEEIKEESSWRYPLAIFIATLVLCAVFLYYYVGPSAEDLTGNVPSPAVSEEPVAFSVGGVNFAVPTNYTEFPRDRRGGERDEVALYLLWPTLTGYTPARRDDFVEQAPDTRRINVTIEARKSPKSEAQRIEKLYMPQVADPRGVRTPFQMVKYTFRKERADVSVPSNGYALTDLYLGRAVDNSVIAIMCFNDQEEFRSPECWREYELSPSVTVTYRFKRPYLSEWQAIDAKVRAWVEGLKVKPRS